MKIIFCLISLLLSQAVSFGNEAKTETNEAGIQVWIQHEIIPTPRLFDLAIQGLGFFVLKYQDKTFLTRHGAFQLNPNGFLVYKDSVFEVQSSESSSIDIGKNLTNSEGSLCRSISILKSGTIELVYADGSVHSMAQQIGLAKLESQIESPRIRQHLFLANDSVEYTLGRPAKNRRGQIYASSLESIDSHSYLLFENKTELPMTPLNMYEINIKSSQIVDGEIIESIRTRNIQTGNQWWQLSGNDNLVIYGKLNAEGSHLKLSTISFPINRKCPTSNSKIVFELDAKITTENSSDICSLKNEFQITKIK